MNRVNDAEMDLGETPAIAPKARGSGFLSRVYLCVVFILALSLLFLKPLSALARLAFADPLYGHLPLIPLVSIYLIWLKRDTVTPFIDSVARTRFIAPFLAPLILGLTALAYWFVAAPEWKAISANSASLLTLSYVCFVWTIVMAVFGWDASRRILFPLVFLVFLVPFPTALTHQIEAFFSTHRPTLLPCFLASLKPRFCAMDSSSSCQASPLRSPRNAAVSVPLWSCS
jgi:hypothetical protein